MRGLIRNVVLLTAGLIAWDASLLRAEPIHDAARKGDIAEVKRLLEQDPKLVNLVERAMNSGVTPLHYAAESGHKAVAELLLASGAKIDARGSYGTALELAVFFGHRDVAELLLAKGARLNIFTAAGLGNTDEMERFLRADKTLIDAADHDGQSVLHWAAYTGQKAAAELLLAKGAKVDQQKTIGGSWIWSGTPLHYAAWAGRKELADLLLAHQADVNARDDWGRTPLFVAVYNSQVAVAEVLITHKADVNACENRVSPYMLNVPITPNGVGFYPSLTTPLHLAAKQDSIDLVKLLLANKAEVNAKEDGGDTPLKLTKSKAVAELLRAPGPKSSIQTQGRLFMPRVLISDKLESSGLDLLRQAGFELDEREGLKGAELKAALQAADGVIIRSGTTITADLLENPGRLRAIARAGVGVDNIDVAAATRKGVVVMNTPGGNTVSTAEQTITLLMAVARLIPAADAHVRSCPAKWQRASSSVRNWPARRSASSASAASAARSPAAPPAST